MNIYKETIKIQNEIINILNPGEYVKIDNIAIDLLAHPRGIETAKDKRRCDMFDRAYKDLILAGRVELNGNSIRLNL